MTTSDGWAETAISGQVHEHMDMLQKLVFNYELGSDIEYLEENLMHCLNFIYALKGQGNG